jgi:hypothetical protein
MAAKKRFKKTASFFEIDKVVEAPPSPRNRAGLWRLPAGRQGQGRLRPLFGIKNAKDGPGHRFKKGKRLDGWQTSNL